jgi:hypothetical protein
MASQSKYAKRSEHGIFTGLLNRSKGNADPMTTPNLASALEIFERPIGFDTTSRWNCSRSISAVRL